MLSTILPFVIALHAATHFLRSDTLSGITCWTGSLTNFRIADSDD